MPEPDNQVTPTPDPTPDPQAAPTPTESRDVIAELQAAARAHEASRAHRPLAAMRSPGAPDSRLRRTLLILVALTIVLLLGGTLVSLGVAQLRGAGARQTAEQIAKQREADLLASQQASEQALAAQEASEQAAIPEGNLASTRIATLTTMRAELVAIIDSLKAKAAASSSASSAWDSEWSKRQSAYSSAYAAVTAHNARERARHAASRTEVSRNGQLVVVYTYTARLESYPARPSKPAPLKASVDAEKKRLSDLQGRVSSLVSTVATDAASARYFSAVFQAVDAAARDLGAVTTDARRVTNSIVVTKGSKGQVVDGSKLKAINLGALDSPFTQLASAFTSALTTNGLTAAQVTGSATATP